MKRQLVTETWETLLRAQSMIARELVAGRAWDDLAASEYGILCALASAPAGLRMSELCKGVLLSQPGLSRLVARLESRGLIVRNDDPEDGRASLLCLSKTGRHVQRRIGAAYGRRVAEVLASRLDDEQMSTLTELCLRLVGAFPTSKQRKV